MTKATLSKSIRKLPINDRIELIDELWHSLAADQASIPVPDWQKEMIEENLAHIEANPGKGMSQDKFKRKIKLAIRRMEANGEQRKS